jgi:hypothetical protein
MGLKYEAFFILKSKGGGFKESYCRPCKAEWACAAHKERESDTLLFCQTQGTF